MPGGFPCGLELCNAQSSISGSPSSKGTSITAGHGSYGSWTQIIASTSYDACWINVRIWPTNNSSFRTFTNIGVGSGGNEVAIASDLYASSGTAGTSFCEYWIPCCIPAGTRISAQCNNSATTDSNNVQITLYDGAFTMMEGAAGLDSIGGSPPTATDVDPGGSASTYGSWTQLTASTPRDYMGLLICVGQNSTDNAAYLASTPCYVELAVGGSGSEQLIVPDYGFASSNPPNITSQWCPFLPIPIPSGTRISARVAQGNTTSGTRVVGVMAYGVYQ